MSLISITNSVRASLASNYMFVEDDWINGFAEFLAEISETTISEDELRNVVREQWLMNDLKDICPGSLPPNLIQKQKTVLTGNYVLQINSAIDIGSPAYQQYLKLQKVNMENVELTTKFEDKVPSHRMVKLNLTDGVQDISAIEYRPMRNLSCDIIPGCKILIKGPVECRRGVILLKESSIELLGGEVKEIINSNSLAGLLSLKLNLPIIKEADPSATLNLPKNTNIPMSNAEIPSALSIDNYETPSYPTSRPVARVTCVQAAIINNDIVNTDMLNSQFNMTGKRPTNDLTEKPEKKLKISNTNQPDSFDNIDMLEEDDFFNEIKVELAGSVNEVSQRATSVSEPYVFIKKINELSDSNRKGRVFTVKAQITSLLSKLAVEKDGWSLKCTIADGTGSLDAHFTSEVLSQLIGYTPQEIYRLKKDVQSSPELQEEFRNVFSEAKEKLKFLYCLMELTMLEVPKITKLTPFNSKHVELLKLRLQQAGL